MIFHSSSPYVPSLLKSYFNRPYAEIHMGNQEDMCINKVTKNQPHDTVRYINYLEKIQQIIRLYVFQIESEFFSSFHVTKFSNFALMNKIPCRRFASFELVINNFLDFHHESLVYRCRNDDDEEEISFMISCISSRK